MDVASRTRVIVMAVAALLTVIDVPGDARLESASAAAGYRLGPLVGGQHTIRLENVEFSYTGVSDEYARAMARVVVAARNAAVEEFGFRMPETLRVAVAINPKVLGGRQAALWTNGRDCIGLRLKSESDLRKPSKRNSLCPLYLLCYEVAELTMHHATGHRSWMTHAATDGWGQYLGARLVDEVYAREGKTLWPDAYDYRDFGMSRLRWKLALPPAESRVAALWEELAKIVGDQGVAPIFEAWGKATVDPANPAEALGKALTAVSNDKRVSAWWDRAQEKFVQKRP